MQIMARISRLGNSIWEQHRPLHYLKDGGIKTCLMVLNQPLDCNLLRALWKSAVIKICTDGGINRLNAAVGNDADSYIPDVISGDFDSACDDLLERYKQKGSSVIHTPDQNETDFTKGLRVMAKTLEKCNKIDAYDCIVCLGAFGGRFDHAMSNVNTLFVSGQIQKKQCYLLSANQLVFLLSAGSHVLHFGTGYESTWCGLLPIGSPADRVFTTGLKWNLNGERLCFGSLVSTSNTIEGSTEVTIETTGPLLWTMGVDFC